MSRFISEILNAPEPSFSHAIGELETLAGRPGVDIRLANELKQLFKEKAQALGLDENDTTVRELYSGLGERALEDSDKLAGIIGINANDSPKAMTEKAIAYVKKRLGQRSAWSLKPSTAKKQLKENPPKKLMKMLGIRSIDSALKRESPSVFYCFATRSEPSSWTAKYVTLASKLTSSDFDSQPITMNVLAGTKIKQLAKAGLKLNHMTYSHPETASIQIVPMNKRFAGDVLFLTDSLFNHARNIMITSAYLKHQSFQPDFFSKVEQIRAHGFSWLTESNQPFSWNTLLHGASELGIPGLVSSAGDSVVSVDDFLVPSLPQVARLDIWKHPFALYVEPGAAVSFNLSDMIVNAINRSRPEDAYIQNGREGLRRELFSRYLNYEPVRNRIIEE